MASITIRVLGAERAQGSWDTIAETFKRITGSTPMKVRDEKNRAGLEIRQVALSVLQPEFTRGGPCNDWHDFTFARVEIHKGDWIVQTDFGALVLTDDEYEEFVE